MTWNVWRRSGVLSRHAFATNIFTIQRVIQQVKALCLCLIFIMSLLTGIIVVCVTTGASVSVVSTQRPLAAGGRLLVSPRRDKSFTCQVLYVLCFSLECGIWAKSLLGYFCFVCIWIFFSCLLEIFKSFNKHVLTVGIKVLPIALGLLHQIWVLFMRYILFSVFSFWIILVSMRVCGLRFLRWSVIYEVKCIECGYTKRSFFYG